MSSTLLVNQTKHFRCPDFNSMGEKRALLSNTDCPVWFKSLQQASVSAEIQSKSFGGWRTNRIVRLVTSGPEVRDSQPDGRRHR